MNSCTEWRCAKRVRKTGWYQRLIMRASESPNYSDLRLRRERNRWFADSPLEGRVTSELVSEVDSGARKNQNQIFRGFWMIPASENAVSLEKSTR